MKILVINAGSSSLKYQLIDMDNEQMVCKGNCERIGMPGGIFTHKTADGRELKKNVNMLDHAAAFMQVKNALIDGEYGVINSLDEVAAVGHRIVQGGSIFHESVLVDEKVMPGVPMVAVFDTAFHQTMPPHSYIYALPYEYYENDKVRRYGFHGTSHKYVSQRAAAMLGKPIEELKLISCHLGNGSSITAIDGGKSVDTSMGFTPLAGLPMGTRSGDLDAGILEYLMHKHGYNIDEMLNVLNKKSGVLGISGVSSDFRDLEAAAPQGNQRAQLALDVFDYSVKKFIGSYAAAMGGVDAIIFTAGVGENGPDTRANVVSGLEFMGVKIDPEKNNTRGKEVDVATDDSKVRILVIPTNEELMIAMDTAAIARG